MTDLLDLATLAVDAALVEQGAAWTNSREIARAALSVIQRPLSDTELAQVEQIGRSHKIGYFGIGPFLQALEESGYGIVRDGVITGGTAGLKPDSQAETAIKAIGHSTSE
jgi:hypothetical protein